VLTAVRVVSAVVSMSLLVVVGYAWKNVHDLNAGLQTLPIPALARPTSGASAGPGATTGSTDPDIDGKDQNILIIGNDDRTDMTDKEVRDLGTGRDGGSINTDTMIVVHVPADGSKATLISLPRDSYVDIPGYQKSKLNAAYPDGWRYGVKDGASERARKAAGANELVLTIDQLTGLHIDHFVQIDLIGFYRISKAIGRISVNLCNATSDPTGSHFVGKKGKQWVVGKTALEFVRQRDNLPHFDLDRTARQRYFLAAAFRSIESARILLNPGALHNLIKAVDSSIYVDTNGFSIEKFAVQLSNLDANHIVGTSIPTAGTGTVDGAGSVLYVDPAKVKTFVTGMINGTPARAKPGKHRVTPKTRPVQKPADSGCIN
jgi:LCP family protein required for cell wall assembly